MGGVKSVIKDIKTPKIRLNRDTILISPEVWKLFNPQQYHKYNNSYDIIKANLSSIHYIDYDKVIAYIGNLSERKLSLLSDRFIWLQIPSHGYNEYDRKLLYKNDNICVTCVKDVFSEPIAQYCITAYYLFNTYSFRPKENKSNRIKSVPDNVRVMIFGLGNIGMALAKKCISIGWTVIGVKRNISKTDIPGIEAIYKFSDALLHLNEVDYVVNLLPESKETTEIFNLDFFSKMNSDALFCNVGRKSAVVDKDISVAVKNHVIRGAILDAHNEYNYGTPDIILTGHSSSVSPENDERFDKYYTAQLSAFINGQELQNRIPLR